MNNLGELSTREVACFVDVHALVQLLDGEPASVDRIADLLHDRKDLLQVGGSPLGLVLLLDHGLL